MIRYGVIIGEPESEFVEKVKEMIKKENPEGGFDSIIAVVLSSLKEMCSTPYPWDVDVVKDVIEAKFLGEIPYLN